MSKSDRSLAAVVLAAGKGKRMKSDLPKVLHPLGGQPMVCRVLDMLQQLQVDRSIAVIGHKAELVRETLADQPVSFADQTEQLGTGHAVMMARDELDGFEGDVIVLAGDVPMLRASTVRSLLKEHRERSAVGTVLTAILPDPAGYGRVVRNKDGLVLKIVEHKDADEDELKIAEINTGTFVFDKTALYEALDSVDNKNSQGEYYLTDVMQIFLEKGLITAASCVEDYRETLGVNSKEQLAELEKHIAAF